MAEAWHEKTILYFSWVRERVGMEEEIVAVPQTVATVNDLFDWLRSRGEEFESAFEHQDTIRVALDKEHVDHDAPIDQAREIALFPPMTGG